MCLPTWTEPTLTLSGLQSAQSIKSTEKKKPVCGKCSSLYAGGGITTAMATGSAGCCSSSP